MKQHGPTSSRSHGFTLIEMMTSLAVLAILLAIVPPSLAAFVSTSRVRAAQSELVSSLMLARSEAAKRGKSVLVTALAPTSGNEFSAGWTVWVDEDDSGTRNAGDTVVRQFPNLSAGVVLSTIGNVTEVSFAPTGFLTTASAVTFKICGKNDPGKGYTAALQPMGLTDVSDRATCP
ncbi:MAG: GspH/FimT family pseudopilin [Pseudomonadota bacterium]|nr:GspH/FimT family pseudopilin [Pseudomonadota bacterium]